MNSISRFLLPNFFRRQQKLATDFLDRQLFSLKVTIYLTFVFKALFQGLSMLDTTESPHIPTNALTIVVSCVPAFYFLKTNKIQYAKFFAYFPTIFIQGLSSYYVILEGLPFGYAELSLLAYIPACILFYQNTMVVVGIAVNILLFVGVKMMRFQLYHLGPHELTLDLTMSMLVYTAMIIITFLYKNDFFTLKKNNDALNAQKKIIEVQADNLKAINDTKNRLFSIISHDLRSPLAALINVMQLFDKEHLSKDEFRELSKRLQQNTSSLYEMLDGLLQWSLSQTEGIKPVLSPCNLNDIIAETTEFVRDVLTQKQISLVVDTSVGQQVLVDEYQIKTVARNLLSNAIKFTPIGGQITVSQRIVSNFANLTITDTGIGITENDLVTLFHSPKISIGTDGERGTGFGLFLCKELIEKNGGQITIKSKIGVGTSINILLPVSNS
jgi:signal transduction histidine kinase